MCRFNFFVLEKDNMGKGSFWIKIWRIIVVYYVFYVRILFGFNGCDEYYSLKVE